MKSRRVSLCGIFSISFRNFLWYTHGKDRKPQSDRERRMFMNKDLLKRVGMLTAATAACTAGVFGVLAVNGLRYMRPTTDNWWLLPWVEPAARIEQSVMDFQDSSAPSYTITGYDAQNREIWSSTTFGRLTLVGSSRYVYTGNTEVQYNWGEGQPAVVWQYDEQGRLIREEIPGEAVTNFFYHGNETKPYLEKSYNGQNVQLLQKTTETDSSTGNTITLCMWYEEDGTFSDEGTFYRGCARQYHQAGGYRRGRRGRNLCQPMDV